MPSRKDVLRMKKTVSMCLALVLVFCLAAPAFAATNPAPADRLVNANCTYVVIAKDVNIRSSASSSSNIVRKESYGFQFHANATSTGPGSSRGWALVQAGQWLSGDYVVKVNFQTSTVKRTVKVTGGSLNVRTGPTTDAPVARTLANGTTVYIDYITDYYVNGWAWARIKLSATGASIGWTVMNGYLV